jgi:hypothetical protein
MNTSPSHDFGLGNRRNGYTDRASFDLPSRDVHAFMCFGVRAKSNRLLPRKTAHFVEIRLETLQIKQQAWGGQILDFLHESECSTSGMPDIPEPCCVRLLGPSEARQPNCYI